MLSKAEPMRLAIQNTGINQARLSSAMRIHLVRKPVNKFIQSKLLPRKKNA